MHSTDIDFICNASKHIASTTYVPNVDWVNVFIYNFRLAYPNKVLIEKNFDSMIKSFGKFNIEVIRILITVVARELCAVKKTVDVMDLIDTQSMSINIMIFNRAHDNIFKDLVTNMKLALYINKLQNVNFYELMNRSIYLGLNSNPNLFMNTIDSLLLYLTRHDRHQRYESEFSHISREKLCKLVEKVLKFFRPKQSDEIFQMFMKIFPNIIVPHDKQTLNVLLQLAAFCCWANTEEKTIVIDSFECLTMHKLLMKYYITPGDTPNMYGNFLFTYFK